MFYYLLKVVFSIIILLSIYSWFNKKEIRILEVLVLLFIFNVCFISIIEDYSFVVSVLLVGIILLIYYLYIFLYNKKIASLTLDDKVFINRGIVNFHELIKENYSYDELLYNLKKKGISNPSLVDYCIKKDNELIIFRKNSIKNYPISLIIDGKVLKDNLISINRSYEWLESKLSDNNLELKDINYAYFKNQDIYFVTN